MQPSRAMSFLEQIVSYPTKTRDSYSASTIPSTKFAV